MVNFYIDNFISQTIEKLSSEYKIHSGTEIELRFFKQYDNQKKAFIPNILYEDYIQLEKFLKDSQLPSLFEESTVEIYTILNETYRKITTGNNVVYQTKSNIYNTDTIYKDFKLRLSVSEEKQIDPPSLVGLKPKITRKRYRHEYIFNQFYKYSLTRIEEVNSLYLSKPVYTYEFEIEFNFLNIKPTVEIVEQAIEYILPILVSSSQTNKSYLPLSLIDYIKKYRKDLFLEHKLKEVKPVNLSREEASQLYQKEYDVTNKLDGEHFYVLLCEDGIFAVNDRTVEGLSKQRSSSISIVDTEYYQNFFYIFDYLLKNNISQFEDKTHMERIKEAETDFNKLSFIKIKEFSFDLYNFSKNFLNDPNNIKTNDGLIYTSSNGLEVKKWKYQERMTLDFLVNFVGVYKGYNVYKLYLGDKNNQIKVFEGSPEFPFKHDPVLYTESKLINNGIYEIGFDHKKGFILHRQRPDKIIPNYYWTTGVNVWNDINNPFTQKELLELLEISLKTYESLNGPLKTQNKQVKVLEEYRRYHNDIKRMMINTFCPSKKVLDLGAGNGGDLGKYEKVNVNYLWAVEPYQKNYEEFIKRINESFPQMKTKTKLIIGKAQDTSIILEEMAGEMADVISSFFSLSFFFFNTSDLNKLVETISQTSRPGGLFIGTTIDGIRLKRLLKQNNGYFEFEGGSYKLLEDGTIEVIMEGTIVQKQKESLVRFKLLKDKLKAKGFVLRETHFFEENPKLSKTENIISSLYRTFVFEKKNPDCNQLVLKYLYVYCVRIGIATPQKYTILELVNKIKKLSDNFKPSSNKFLNLVDETVKDYITLKEDEHFPERMCPDWSPIDYSKFVIDYTSLYSSLTAFQINAVRKTFSQVIKQPIYSIIDATSNIGVDTVNFSQMYPKANIISYEIVSRIYKKLVKNIKIFGLEKRVKTVNGDFLESNEKVDLIYIDAPFGGKDYKLKENLSLYLQKEGDEPDESKNILNVARDLLDSNRSKYVVLKVPFNFQKDFFVLTEGDSGIKIVVRDIMIKEKIQFKLIFLSKEVVNKETVGKPLIKEKEKEIPLDKLLLKTKGRT